MHQKSSKPEELQQIKKSWGGGRDKRHEAMRKRMNGALTHSKELGLHGSKQPN